MQNWIESHLVNLFIGLLTAVLGYFAPVVGVVNVMVLAIMLDLTTGVLASRKRGKGIKSKLLWRTGEKMFYAVAIVSLLFAIDRELSILEMHRFMAFIIIGWEVWSILENAAYLTDHPAFKLVQKYVADKTEDLTGIDLTKKE